MSEIKFVSVSAGKILFPLTEDNKVRHSTLMKLSLM